MTLSTNLKELTDLGFTLSWDGLTQVDVSYKDKSIISLYRDTPDSNWLYAAGNYQPTLKDFERELDRLKQI